MSSTPAPRRSVVGSDMVETPVPREAVSELTFLRNATIVWSACFFLLPAISRPAVAVASGEGGDLHFCVIVALAGLLGCAVMGAVALVVHARRFYLATVLTAITVYTILLTLHGAFLLGTGDSPLSQLYLGDFVGLPAALLLIVLPAVPGVVVALALIAIASVLNAPLPWDDPVYLAVAVGHAWIALAPFLIIISRMLAASHLADDMAVAAYRSAMRLARSTRLEEVENRFLSHVHDTVMADLRSVASGRLSPEQLSARLPHAPEAPPVPVHYVIMRLVGAAGDDTRTILPAHVDRSATMPAATAAVLLDMVTEALSNSRQHASQASRSMRVRTDSGLRVEVTDDGPGFNLSDIPADRAGVRSSILRAGELTPGLTAEVDSAPGRGTVVRMGWNPETEEVGAAPRMSDLHLSGHQLVGVERLIHPVYLTSVMVVFFFLAWVSDQSSMWLLIPAAVALVAFSQGPSLQVPQLPALVVAGGVLLMVTGQQLTGSDFPDYWPGAWTLSAASILLSLLALRSRVALAWATLGVLVVLSAAQLTVTGAVPIRPVDFLTTVALLTPSSLIPLLIRRTVRRLPELLQRQEDALVKLEETAAQRTYLRESGNWLGRQIAGVRDSRSAVLMEQRLRDAIRSPLLDVPEVTRAVWNARDRGVKVQLVDDRSPATATQAKHTTFLALLTEVLAELGPGETLTARLLPAGRQTYATLVTSEPRRFSV